MVLSSFDWTRLNFTRYPRLILLIVFQLAILTLCTLQIMSITRTYILSETISKVDLSYPHTLTLPSVTLCVSFLATLDKLQVIETWPSMKPIFSSSLYSEDFGASSSPQFARLYQFLGNLSLASLKEIMKPAVSKIIKEITPAQLEPGIGTRVVCNDTRYVIEPRFCITISCFDVTERDNGSQSALPVSYPRHVIFEPRYAGRMLTIGIDKDAINEVSNSMTISFSSPGSFIARSYFSSYFLDLSAAESTFMVTYSMIRNDMDSISREINCTPSGDPVEGKGDQQTRYNYCLNQAARKSLGCSFYGTVQRIDDENLSSLKLGYHQYYREFYAPDGRQREVDRSHFNYIRINCSLETDSPNCIEEIYTPVGDRFSRKYKHDFTIIINAPTTPFENNEFFLEVSLLDYLIYISSSLNFWFGISIISIFDRFISSIHHYLNSRQYRAPDNQQQPPQSSPDPLELKRNKRLRVLSKFNSLNKPNLRYN